MSIEYLVFGYCTSLTNVIIGNSVTSIEEAAFYDCESLASVTIPDSVRVIEGEAFHACSSLTSITIPDSVVNISSFYDSWGTAYGAFSSCTSLPNIMIGSSVTNIGEKSFSDRVSLRTVTIPASVTSIGASAFGFCSSLTIINLDSMNAGFFSLDGVLCDKNKTMLIQCPGAKVGSYNIPAHVANIGDYGFAECSALTSVTIPNSVTSIGNGAFQLVIPRWACGAPSVARF